MMLTVKTGNRTGLGVAAGMALVGTVLLAGCGSRKEPDVRHHEQGLIYLQKTRDYAKAAREFEKALDVNPNRPDTVYLLGRAYLLSRRYEEALKAYNRLQDLGDLKRADLGRSDAYLARAGWRLVQAGNYEKVEQFTPIGDDLATAAEYASACHRRTPDDPEGVLHLARVAMERRRFHEAKRGFLLEAARRARELGNDAQATAQQRQASDENQKGTDQLKEAADLYQKVTTLDPKNLAAYRQQIEIAGALGEPDRAETPARRLLAVQSDSDLALATLAEIAFRTWQRTQADQHAEEGKAFAERILQRVPGDERANLLMAHYALATDQYDVAIEHAQRVLERNGKHGMALRYRGAAFLAKARQYIALGKRREAQDAYSQTVDSFQRVLSLDTRWSDPEEESRAWSWLAEAYQGTLNPREALSALHQAVKIDPKNTVAIEALGIAYVREGRLDDARALLDRANAASEALGQLLQGWIHEAEAGQKWAQRDDQAYRELMRKAKDCYDRAAEGAPDSLFARHRGVKKLLAAGKYEEAITECDRVLAADRHRQDLEIRYYKAGAQARLGRLKEAIETCREIIALNPAYSPSHLLITDIYLRYGRPDLAIRYGEAAVKEGAGHSIYRRLAILYLSRAWVRRRAGDREAEKKDLAAVLASANRLREKSPDDMGALLQAAEVQQRLGDREAAQDLIDRALKLNPKNARALHVAGEAARLGGNLARARQLYEEALAADPRQLASVYPLGMVLVAEGRADEALKRFQDARHSLGVVVSLHAAGRPDAAAEVAAKALEALGPSGPLGKAQVMALMGANKHPEALAAVDAIEKGLEGGQPLVDLRPLRHLRDLVEMVKDNPQRARQVALQATLAEFYRLGGWNERAAASAKRALALVPESVDRMLALLTCLAAAGDQHRQEILELAQQIVKADEAWPHAHATLAAYHQRDGRFLEAEREFRRAVELAPDKPEFRLHLGQFYEQRGQVDKAQQKALWDKALAVYRAAADDPNLQRVPPIAYRTYNNLAYFLALHAGDVTAAEEVAAKATALADQYPAVTRNPKVHGTVLDTVGWVQHLSGKHAEAVKTLQRANLLLPFDATLLYHLGMAYLGAGDKANARRCLSEAIEVAPDEGFAHLEEAKRALASLGQG